MKRATTKNKLKKQTYRDYVTSNVDRRPSLKEFHNIHCMKCVVRDDDELVCFNSSASNEQ